MKRKGQTSITINTKTYDLAEQKAVQIGLIHETGRLMGKGKVASYVEKLILRDCKGEKP